MIDLFMERSSGMQAYETLREKVKIAWYASVTQPVINFRGGGGAFSYRPVVQTAFCIYLCYLCIILYISLVIWNMCDQLRDFSRHCTIQNTVVEVRSKCPNIGIMLHMTCIFAWYADWVKYVFYTNTYIRYSGFKCISFCTHSNVLPMMVEDTSPIITVFKI